jgi:hypothetical protein
MTDTPLREHIASYLRLHQQSLGKSFVDEAKVLRAFDRYVSSCGYLGPVTQELAIAFATDGGKRSPERSWKRYNVIRFFAQYLAVFVPGTSTLDPRALRRHYKRSPPFIFSEHSSRCCCARRATRSRARSPRSRTTRSSAWP